ncbi:hypothetical protein [Archangium lipolyticum]|uniref:hypothetical protein n=1 Tax=Archangium lipolyticum TaxID=2970465 RepID=UPI00214A2EB0|nr:hypothetical protein [Archangium lipolyticum]
MSRCVALRCVLALLLLVPAMAGAEQGRSWDAPTREGGSRSRLRLVEEPAGDAPRRIPDVVQVAPLEHPLGMRLLVETGAGLGTGLAGGLVGVGLYMMGSGLRLFSGDDGRGVLPFALAGMAAGFPLGVWWGGALMAGDGSLLWTVGGFALGALSTVGLWNLAESSREPLASILVVAPIPLAMAGALLGYELSSSARKKARGLQVQPALVLGANHQAMVLAGSF